MCGLAGILQPDPQQYSLADLQRMTHALAHRGPDGEHHWRSDDGTVLLGHRRLKMLDLSDHAKQPLSYLNRYTLIHNGEIYNYLELKESLSQKGYPFQTTGDTEVIAAAYDHWGTDCLSHFDGMFAFALWDSKERTLFAARDRFGEKPFYYALQNHTLLFASEIKAFWALGLPKQTNPQLAFHYLTLGYVDDPLQPDRTFFQEILKLPAAHYLKYSAIYRTATIQRYWDIDLTRDPSNLTETETLQHFQELLHTSVHRRLRSDVPIGCSLSGGLDSSALAHQIHKQTNIPLHTFTAIFPQFDRNEEASARTLAQHIQAKAHFINLTETDWLTTGLECLQQQDEPVGSSSVFAQYAVYRAIAQEGIKGVIEGQGADETLAGYERYYPWYWQELYRKRQWHSSREKTATQELNVDVPFHWKNKLAAFFPQAAARQRQREYQQQAKRNTELNESFRREQLQQFHHAMPEHPGLNGALYFNTCTHGLEELLRYADRNAMRFGVETRLPFLSHELVEFIFSLPPHFKIRQGWRKWILRQSMDKHLPHSICWNPNKIGYETPQAHWMQQPDFQEAIYESRKKLIREKILAPAVADRPIQPQAAHAPNPRDWRYFSLAHLLTD